MPKTTFQRFVFTFFGVLFMATTMAFFNKYIVMNPMFSNDMDSAAKYAALWSATGVAFCQKAPLAFALQFFLVQKFAGKQTAKFHPDNIALGYMIRTAFSVMIMCPIMSLYSNLFLAVQLHWSFIDLLYHWIPKMVLNGFFAYGIQMMVLQPINRAIFKSIFAKQNMALAGVNQKGKT